MARRHTILIVDDEPDVVKSVQDLLRLDYRVLGATRAADGIKILQTEEVHVVMSDQRMPEMTGVQFFNHIRGQHPDAIRLLFTGYADIRAVIDAINQGNVYRYITKPWDPDELQSVIREAVERYDRIVDHKRLSEELLQKNDVLEQARLELLRADDLKTAFVLVENQELRAPLAMLAGLTSLVSRRNDLSPMVADRVSRMNRAIERLQYLLKRSEAKLAAKDFSLRTDVKETQIAGLLRDVVEDLQPFIQSRSQQVLIEGSADLGSIPIDATAVRDSLNQLLLGAIPYAPEKGTITLRGRRWEGGIELRITGTGFFEPSLPIFPGGSIRVESEPGLSTTFVVTLTASI